MSKSHRLAWIDAQVRAGRFPNAKSVAERFEISRRQAARDIEYLRYSMGAPLEYSAARNGYFYTDDTFVLPAVVVSDTERSALSYLAERYTAMDGEAAASVAAVLRRVSAHSVVDDAPGAQLPVVAVAAAEMQALDALRSAISSRNKVLARYRGADGVVVSRSLEPYAIVNHLGTLSCLAYCDELGVTHTFPLSRFDHVERTGEVFEVPPFVQRRDWDRQMATRTLSPEPFVAVVRLENPAHAERLEAAVAQDDGTYRIEFLEPAAMISALLSCPSPFEVVSPKWLRARVRDRAAELLRRHADERRPE